VSVALFLALANETSIVISLFKAIPGENSSWRVRNIPRKKIS
jgi:hypothetical protein